jgi:hypothetical protein
MLTQGGVVAERASQYVIAWQRQLNRPRRAASVETVLDWYRRGLIDVNMVVVRLRNLGVTNSDQVLYIARANLRIEEDIRRQLAIEARTEQQRIRETDRLRKEMEANARRAISDFKSFSGIPQIRKWYLSGLLTEDEVRQRLTFIQVPFEDQERYLAQWSNGNE